MFQNAIKAVLVLCVEAIDRKFDIASFQENKLLSNALHYCTSFKTIYCISKMYIVDETIKFVIILQYAFMAK